MHALRKGMKRKNIIKQAEKFLLIPPIGFTISINPYKEKVEYPVIRKILPIIIL